MKRRIKILQKSISNIKLSINYIWALGKQEGSLLQHILLSQKSGPKPRGAEFMPHLVMESNKESGGTQGLRQGLQSAPAVPHSHTLLTVPDVHKKTKDHRRDGNELKSPLVLPQSKTKTRHNAGENKWFESC